MQTKLEHIEKFKQIAVESFERKAKVFDKKLSEMHYCFKLKDSHHFICRYGDNAIKLVEEIPGLNFVTRPIVEMKVNSFITSSLIRFAEKYGIGKGNVNIVMGIDEDKKLSLVLRNQVQVIKPIHIEELII